LTYSVMGHLPLFSWTVYCLGSVWDGSENHSMLPDLMLGTTQHRILHLWSTKCVGISPHQQAVLWQTPISNLIQISQFLPGDSIRSRKVEFLVPQHCLCFGSQWYVPRWDLNLSSVGCKSGICMTPCSGSINLLEWLTALEETLLRLVYFL
jgi:hypothetical protein